MEYGIDDCCAKICDGSTCKIDGETSAESENAPDAADGTSILGIGAAEAEVPTGDIGVVYEVDSGIRGGT